MGCVQLKPRTIIIPQSPQSTNRNIIVISSKSKTKQEADNINVKKMIKKVDSPVQEKYKINEKIGSGSQGSVFKVINIRTGITRAMKIISKDMLDCQDDEQIFLKEIEVLIETDHPNIVKIYEYFEDDKNYYIITEHIEGQNLIDALATWDFYNEEKLAYIIYQLLSAVNYLHSTHIIHRDIKLENIMLVKPKRKGEENN